MKQFFQEDSKLSMTRLLSLLTVVTGLAMGVIVAVRGNANTSLATIAIAFVSTGLGSKIIQKVKEKS